MNRVRRLGLALIVIGGLVAVAASDGFVTSTAERDFAIGTAQDSDQAYLGIDLPAANQNQVIELNSDEADSGGCFIIWCADYQYENVQIILLMDNVPSHQLEIESLELQTNGDDIHGSFTNESNPLDGIHRLDGDFTCGANPWGQEQATETITMSPIGSNPNGTISVDTEVDVTVECA